MPPPGTIRKRNKASEKIKHKDLLAYVERINDIEELKTLIKSLAKTLYEERAFCKECGSYQGLYSI